MTFRVAVTCDADAPRAWEVRCVEALERADVEVAVVIRCPSQTGLAGSMFGDDVPSRRRVDAPRSYREAPQVTARAKADRVAALDSAALVQLDALRIDAVVHFGDAALALPSARCDVWAFRFGAIDGVRDPEDPPAFDELLRGDPVVRADLIGDRDGVLKTGWFETTPHSYGETADTILFGAAQWPARVFGEIAAGLTFGSGSTGVSAIGARSAGAGRGALARAWRRLALMSKLAARGIALRLHYLFRHEHWNVGIVRRPIATFATGGVARDVDWLPMPARGRFAADPFGLEREGGIDVLCEEFDYRDRRGFLSAARVRAAGAAAEWKPVLRSDVHLSYPFLIERGGAVYCIPESSEADEVALYEASEFPFAWKRRATLLAGFAGADATAFEHEGRWWLLCTGKDGPNRCLYAWHAPDLFGPWAPHARNPVKIDARSARPAGTPFTAGGRLLRPAQDCAGGYGRRVALMHVRTLTPVEFDEERVAWIEPDRRGPCPDGLHTISSAGSATLVDGKCYRFVPREFVRTFVQYARAIGGAKGNSGT
jgi:hypothetical protein